MYSLEISTDRPAGVKTKRTVSGHLMVECIACENTGTVECFTGGGDEFGPSEGWVDCEECAGEAFVEVCECDARYVDRSEVYDICGNCNSPICDERGPRCS